MSVFENFGDRTYTRCDYGFSHAQVFEDLHWRAVAVRVQQHRYVHGGDQRGDGCVRLAAREYNAIFKVLIAAKLFERTAKFAVTDKKERDFTAFCEDLLQDGGK